MGFFTTGRWTESLPVIALVLLFLFSLGLTVLGLSLWGVTWVYTDGPFLGKAVMSVIIVLLGRAVITFVREVFMDPVYDHEEIPY